MRHPQRAALLGWLAMMGAGCVEAPTTTPPATIAGTDSAGTVSGPGSAREAGVINLESHRWKDRLLLVFAPSEADGRLAEQRRIAEAEAAGFSDRDLLVLEIVGLAEQGLRQRYNVGAEDFAVVLIGKDGGEKLRSEKPTGGSVLFPVIDVMPMRRAETGRP
jgi:hypothetical protein